MSTTINPDFCFNPNNNLTSDISNRALRKYVEGFEMAKRLEGELPIILDTNILLGYYGMSQTEKEKLIQFITNYKDRIYLTKQVEQEYLRNRLSTIKKNFFGPLNKISEDFITMKNEISGKLQSFKDDKKKILSQDYPILWEKLRQIENEANAIINDETFFNEIVEQIGTTTQNNKNIAYIDELLDLISSLKLTNDLDENELTFLKGHFEKLLSEYNNARENVRWRFVIPGCGERKDDATGDFIIFHEMLKFMKTNNSSCIFLTNDVTKGDWLQTDKHPHNHYLEHSFLQTDNIIFIIHAELTLPSISFENIHKVSQELILEESGTVQGEERESTIITIDHERGFGFIVTAKENLHFNDTDVIGNFSNLQKNDVVRFIHGNHTNALNVRKIYYSFDNDAFEIKREKVAYLIAFRGFGFISNQPENLYFHQAFMENKDDFDKLKVGDEVDFIVGSNAEGEKIARLVRPAK